MVNIPKNSSGSESMHEMAIAQGILDIVLRTAAQNNAMKVMGVKLLIGQMTQIEPDPYIRV